MLPAEGLAHTIDWFKQNWEKIEAGAEKDLKKIGNRRFSEGYKAKELINYACKSRSFES